MGELNGAFEFEHLHFYSKNIMMAGELFQQKSGAMLKDQGPIQIMNEIDKRNDKRINYSFIVPSLYKLIFIVSFPVSRFPFPVSRSVSRLSILFCPYTIYKLTLSSNEKRKR